jgi:hypothetical protein
VSDLPGVAQLQDPNLINPWGVSESSSSTFWISDNNAGVASLYSVPGAGNTPVSINGSLGASCNVEVELDQALLFDDVEAFQERVTSAYAACRQAVAQELDRRRSTSIDGAKAAATAETVAKGQSNGRVNGQSNSKSDGHNGHRASQKQIDYAQQLAGQIRGLGVRRLEDLAHTMFAKPLADLSSLDASGLIDALKDIKAGKIELAAVLGGESI